MPAPIRPELEVIAANLRESAYTAEELGDDGLCADLSRAAEDIERHVAEEAVDPNVTFAFPPLSRAHHRGRVVDRKEKR